MRVPVSNARLPGITYERDWEDGTVRGEQQRRAIYRDETYLGSVVYVARRPKLREPVTHADGYVQTHSTTYGWRPAMGPANGKLTTLTDAVRKLASPATQEVRGA